MTNDWEKQFKGRKALVVLMASVCAWLNHCSLNLCQHWAPWQRGMVELVMKTRRQKRGGRKEGKETGYRVYLSRLYSQWPLLLTSPHVQHFFMCYEFIVDKSINYAWALWIWPLFSDLNPPAGDQTFSSWAFQTTLYPNHNIWALWMKAGRTCVFQHTQKSVRLQWPRHAQKTDSILYHTFPSSSSYTFPALSSAL